MPFWSRFPAYVSAADKRDRAARAVARLAKQAGKTGRQPEPVIIESRRIATTFWGKAWCDNLEAYADFAHRLGRGRTYVRSGAVVDLHLAPARIDGRVCGSDLYEVSIAIGPLEPAHWKALARTCAGQLSSLVGLLQGDLPAGVISAITHPTTGLFPKPSQLSMSCSCPDRAGVCKHVAACLYGVGARLDARPELLFSLREVNVQDLLEEATQGLTAAGKRAANTLRTDDLDLGALFGIELAPSREPKRAQKKSVERSQKPPRATRKPPAP